MANLKGNTAYLLDIRAVNKVGYGDACEYQPLVASTENRRHLRITTAPVAPDPPAKAWVEACDANPMASLLFAGGARRVPQRGLVQPRERWRVA